MKVLISSRANPEADSTSRSSIEDMNGNLPPPGSGNSPEEDDIVKLIFTSVLENNVDKFNALLFTANEMRLDLNGMNNGRCNLLQFTCEEKYREKFVNVLLNSGANPNATLYDENDSPLLLAAYHGNSGALRLLVDHNSIDLAVSDENAETALHKAAKMEMFDGNGRNYKECIDILTKSIKEVDDEKPKEKRLDVNAIDAEGNTALHYAAYNLEMPGRKVEEIIRALIRAGSCMGIPNKVGEFAISRIPKEAIEDFMNGCIGTNGRAPNDKDYKLTFDYKIIVPPSNLSTAFKEKTGGKVDYNTPIRETELLSYICSSDEHQSLIKHPIITSYLHLKWQRNRWIFYCNLVFYITTCISLTPYILVTFRPNSEEDVSEKMEWKDYFFVFSSILLTVLAFMEFFKLAILKKHYLRKMENWLKLQMIVLNMVILFAKLQYQAKKNLASVSILLLWIVLFFEVGQHPRLSTCITMFKNVLRYCISFLICFSILISAFTLSIVILLNKEKTANEERKQEVEEEENSLLSDLSISFLKTAVMLTGQLDLENLHLHHFPSTSGLVFLRFIYLIPPVLMTLLFTCSVSEIPAVAEKDVVGYISQVDFLSQVEHLMLENPLKSLINLVRGKTNNNAFQSVTSKNPDISRNELGDMPTFIITFPPIYSWLKRVEVSVKDGKVQCTAGEETYKYKCSMDPKVIKAARRIILKINGKYG